MRSEAIELDHPVTVAERPGRARGRFEVTIELFARFAFADPCPAHPEHVGNRRRHERLDPIVALDCPLLPPTLQELPSFLHRTNPAQPLPDLIRVVNPRRIGMRVEMNQSVFLVEIELPGQPVERPGVAVLYVYWKSDRPCFRAP